MAERQRHANSLFRIWTLLFEVYWSSVRSFVRWNYTVYKSGFNPMARTTIRFTSLNWNLGLELGLQLRGPGDVLILGSDLDFRFLSAVWLLARDWLSLWRWQDGPGHRVRGSGLGQLLFFHIILRHFSLTAINKMTISSGLHQLPWSRSVDYPLCFYSILAYEEHQIQRIQGGS